MGSEGESLSATIRNISVVVGGIVAIMLATWRSTIADRQANAARQQTEIAQRGLLNERYQKGAEMLGSPILPVRMAGLYALQRLTQDHPDAYHTQIMALLCAFIRNPTRDPSSPASNLPSAFSAASAAEDPDVTEDIQAALTIIGSREGVGRSLESNINFHLDLRNAQIKRADLAGLDFSGAKLTGANLERVRARGANLSSTEIDRAKLVHAELADADLKNASLYDSDLSDASAFRADFSGAVLASAFCRADLSDTKFAGATITHSDFCDATIKGANLTGTRFGTSLRALFNPSADPTLFTAQITQDQLDSAQADVDSPPILASGMTDAVSGQTLVWRREVQQEE